MARSRIGHFYIEDTCIGCGACDHACPGKVDAIYKIEGDFMGRFAIVLEDCIDCGFCVPMCPVDCIRDARQAGIDGDSESGWKKIRELQAWAGRGSGGVPRMGSRN
jgi:formate hydrogenlyase subunit 6/NADH:ubiquinone oxidoreductase subunit I